MASSYTTNKDIEKPGNGDYVDTWNVPLNGDMTVVDYALGTTQTFNATTGSQTLGSYDHSTKNLATYSYVPMFLNITGAISANVTYTIPSGVGGQWIVYNSTTDSTGGPWTITFVSGGGGRTIVLPRLSRLNIVCDGTNVDYLSYVGVNLTTVGSVALTGSVSASSVSDSIGNLRNVPPNAQSSAYVLISSDNGKYVSITTGGVTVPSSTFTAGQTISIYNNSGANQTITQGTGVTMTQAGTANTGNRTLAQNGLATILCTDTNTFVITGAGLS